MWGHLVEQFNVGHGYVKYSKATPELEAVLLGLINPKTLEFLHPEVTLLLSDEYGFKNSLLEIRTLQRNDVKQIMENTEELNSIYGYIKREGVVIHTIIDNKVRMFKVKPVTVMKRDIQYGVDENRILQEYAKVRLEYPIEYIATNFREIIKMIIDYIAEDNKITKAIKDRIFTTVAKEVAKELINIGITRPDIAGRKGVDSAVIYWIIQLTR